MKELLKFTTQFTCLIYTRIRHNGSLTGAVDYILGGIFNSRFFVYMQE